MDEFGTRPSVKPEEEKEELSKEDRPRVIRFAGRKRLSQSFPASPVLQNHSIVQVSSRTV